VCARVCVSGWVRGFVGNCRVDDFSSWGVHHHQRSTSPLAGSLSSRIESVQEAHSVLVARRVCAPCQLLILHIQSSGLPRFADAASASCAAAGYRGISVAAETAVFRASVLHVIVLRNHLR